MQKITLPEALQEILRQDPRYTADGYLFIKEALDYTIKMLGKPTEGVARHVSAAELLEGIRAYALEEFGPMALTVLQTWGLQRTDDIGHAVFNLVRQGILGKTANDKIEDFAGGYDFLEVFRDPFLPPPSSAREANAKAAVPSVAKPAPAAPRHPGE